MRRTLQDRSRVRSLLLILISDNLRTFSLEEINSVLSYSGLVSRGVRNGKCIGKKLLKYLVVVFFLLFLFFLPPIRSPCPSFWVAFVYPEIRTSSPLTKPMLLLLRTGSGRPHCCCRCCWCLCWTAAAGSERWRWKIFSCLLLDDLMTFLFF